MLIEVSMLIQKEFALYHLMVFVLTVYFYVKFLCGICQVIKLFMWYFSTNKTVYVVLVRE